MLATPTSPLVVSETRGFCCGSAPERLAPSLRLAAMRFRRQYCRCAWARAHSVRRPRGRTWRLKSGKGESRRPAPCRSASSLINLTSSWRSLSYFSISTRMNGAGNGKLAAPSTSVFPSKTIVAVAVAERSLRFEPGPLTVVMIGPVPVQRASTETVCSPPRLSRTLANVPLTLTFLRSASNRVGAGCTKPQLKVPSGHWPTKPTLRGGLGSRVVPASMKLSVSTIRRPSVAVVPSGHWNEINQRAEATSSVKPFAADATAGTTSNARVASRETTYLYGREGPWADRLRGNCRPRMSDLLVGGAGLTGRSLVRLESSETGRRETPRQGLRAATGIGSSASSTPPNLRRAQPSRSGSGCLAGIIHAQTINTVPGGYACRPTPSLHALEADLAGAFASQHGIRAGGVALRASKQAPGRGQTT